MSSTSQQQQHDDALSTLDLDIQTLDHAKDTCGIPPAQTAFGSASALLTTIKDVMVNKLDYIDLGTSCAEVCGVLDRGLKGRETNEIGRSVLEAINQLTTTIATIEGKIRKQNERSVTSRLLHAKEDKEMIRAWKRDFNRFLRIFNADLLLNNHLILLDLRQNSLAGQDDIDGRNPSNRASVPEAELPPPPPRACLGRDELIEEIVNLAEGLGPVALIGAGGIGKTSIALKVLHDQRIKDRFGDNRRFIRCDEFPASCAHLLGRLSEVVGAGIEHPEDLAHLRPFLSSKDMILFLDNVGSLLDPGGVESRELYSIVEELSRFSNLCLGITSRISTIPPHFKRPIISTLSMGSACDIFYSIYDLHGRSDVVNNLVRELDFHPLSIELLATTASHNTWDHARLAKEWDAHRTRMLRTDFNKSLAASVEFSLASPTFINLGQNARDLLGVVAFFPQGVQEKDLDSLFPTIPDGNDVIDKLCTISLTYRNNGSITMLAPIRDHFCPRDPKSSPLLCAIKDRYLIRLSSVFVDPSKPRFGEGQWITSEDVNVECLLDAFISSDADADDVWDACVHFMRHLYWYKPRQTILRSKIEALPDNHRSKPKCLFQLARLFQSVGNRAEQKQVLTHTLDLERRWGDDNCIAQTLRHLSDVNRVLDLHEEGMQQAREALGIYERLGDVSGQAVCLNNLAWSLLGGKQLDAAEEAASRTIKLIRGDTSQEFLACESHRVLGDIYHFKCEREKAIHHFQVAIGIAAPCKWHSQLFWLNYSLAGLFLNANRLEDAHIHSDQAKVHAGEDVYRLGRMMEMKARVWYRQRKLENAEAEVLDAREIFEKLGAARDVSNCMELLQKIERARKGWSTNFQRAWHAIQQLGGSSSLGALTTVPQG